MLAVPAPGASTPPAHGALAAERLRSYLPGSAQSGLLRGWPLSRLHIQALRLEAGKRLICASVHPPWALCGDGQSHAWPSPRVPVHAADGGAPRPVLRALCHYVLAGRLEHRCAPVTGSLTVSGAGLGAPTCQALAGRPVQ